jgi:hypothetical protein
MQPSHGAKVDLIPKKANINSRLSYARRNEMISVSIVISDGYDGSRPKMPGRFSKNPN